MKSGGPHALQAHGAAMLLPGVRRGQKVLGSRRGSLPQAPHHWLAMHGATRGRVRPRLRMIGAANAPFASGGAARTPRPRRCRSLFGCPAGGRARGWGKGCIRKENRVESWHTVGWGARRQPARQPGGRPAPPAHAEREGAQPSPACTWGRARGCKPGGGGYCSCPPSVARMMASSSLSLSTGLDRKPFMPAARHSCRSRSLALAVMATIGVQQPSWRMACSAGQCSAGREAGQLARKSAGANRQAGAGPGHTPRGPLRAERAALLLRAHRAPRHDCTTAPHATPAGPAQHTPPSPPHPSTAEQSTAQQSAAWPPTFVASTPLSTGMHMSISTTSKFMPDSCARATASTASRPLLATCARGRQGKRYRWAWTARQERWGAEAAPRCTGGRRAESCKGT